MNDRILFRSDSLTDAASELNRLIDALENVAGDLARVNTSGEWWSKVGVYTSRGRYDGSEAVYALRDSVGRTQKRVEDINKAIDKAKDLFQEADKEVSAAALAAIDGKKYDRADAKAGGDVSLDSSSDGRAAEKSVMDRFIELYQEKFSWSKFLSGAGYIGTIYDFVQDFKKAGSWQDYVKTGRDVYGFIKEAAQTYKNYKKIGNAVGTSKAMGWWVKNITGLKKMKGLSTAKKMSTRFVNNLKNKTSPFNLKKAFGKLTGAEGTGKAVGAWAGVALDGVLNFFDNKAEQAESNGKMSDGRVWAETITETAVGTALTYGTQAVVGAAVAAVAGTAGAPVVLVAGASALIVTAVNAGVEACTGKTATEWISDGILNLGEAAGKAIGSGAKKIKKSVSSWFGKLSFA